MKIAPKKPVEEVAAAAPVEAPVEAQVEAPVEAAPVAPRKSRHRYLPKNRSQLLHRR